MARGVVKGEARGKGIISESDQEGQRGLSLSLVINGVIESGCWLPLNGERGTRRRDKETERSLQTAARTRKGGSLHPVPLVSARLSFPEAFTSQQSHGKADESTKRSKGSSVGYGPAMGQG